MVKTNFIFLLVVILSLLFILGKDSQKKINKNVSLKEEVLNKEKELKKENIFSLSVYRPNTANTKEEKENKIFQKKEESNFSPKKETNERIFENYGKFRKDLRLLYLYSTDDLPYINELKKKLNKTVALNFQSINSLDLLKHILIELELENSVSITKEQEELLENYFVNYSITAKPQIGGEALASILGTAKLSFYFDNGKIYLTGAKIGRKD